MAIITSAIAIASSIKSTMQGARTYFAQEGEDVLLSHLFADTSKGVYVDVGAHDPVAWSTSHALYRRGWSGINIDPRAGTKERFDRARPRDINLEIAVDQEEKTLPFFEFDPAGVSTFSNDAAERNLRMGFRPLGSRMIQCLPLRQVFARHAGRFPCVDYLNIDVEGMELAVLKSNDWDKHRPSVVTVEMIHERENPHSPFATSHRRYWCDIEDVIASPLHQYFTAIGYRLFAKGIASIFYVNSTCGRL